MVDTHSPGKHTAEIVSTPPLKKQKDVRDDDTLAPSPSNVPVRPADDSVPHSDQPDVNLLTRRTQYNVGDNARTLATPVLALRVQKLLQYEDSDRGCFALQRIPDNISWGPFRDRNDNLSTILCSNNQPISILIVAELNSGISAESTAYFYFMPWMESNKDMLDKLMKDFSPPNKDEIRKDPSFYAHAWLSDKKAGKTWSFNQSYDARNEWRGCDSAHFHYSKFVRDDLVLIEMKLSRWISLKDVGWEHNAHGWKNWNVRFELQAVYLLHHPDNSEITAPTATKARVAI